VLTKDNTCLFFLLPLLPPASRKEEEELLTENCIRIIILQCSKCQAKPMPRDKNKTQLRLKGGFF